MHQLTRREFLKRSGNALILTALGSPFLGACQTTPPLVRADGGGAIAGLIAGPTPGVKVQNVREFSLMTAVAPVDLGTGEFQAWTYNDQAVGPEIRVTEGEVIRATLTNHLPDPTTIHWHGIPLPNAMDGVPGVTQAPVQPGETFVYKFVAWPSGTYWYHPHVGHQLDRGLVGPERGGVGICGDERVGVCGEYYARGERYGDGGRRCAGSRAPRSGQHDGTGYDGGWHDGAWSSSKQCR